MNSFEELENIWSRQKDTQPKSTADELIDKVEIQSKKIKAWHLGTIAVISLTAVGLVAYFFWMSAYRHQSLYTGLGIMTGMLVIRILLELISYRKIKNISLNSTLLDYCSKISKFYQWRKLIHYVLTPIIYITYFAGFWSMSPPFKENLSKGFYTYITISGIAIFVFLGYFIFRQIKKEMDILSDVKRLVEE